MDEKQATAGEDPLYLSMLKQIGLSPGQVSTDMRETIYEKLSIKPSS